MGATYIQTTSDGGLRLLVSSVCEDCSAQPALSKERVMGEASVAVCSMSSVVSSESGSQNHADRCLFSGTFLGSMLTHPLR